MLTKGVIFDLDGTIIDNEWVYDRAFCEVLKEFQISCGELNHIPGIGIKENWERMAPRLGIQKSPEELAALTQQAYLAHLKEIKVRDGVRELLHYLRGKRLKTLLATSSVKEVVIPVLDATNLTPLFDSITFGDEVSRKKPAPDLFLKAMDTVGLLPKEVIIIEDSPAGIEAGKNAQARVIALKTDWFTRSQLDRADLILENFTQITDKFKRNHFIGNP